MKFNWRSLAVVGTRQRTPLSTPRMLCSQGGGQPIFSRSRVSRQVPTTPSLPEAAEVLNLRHLAWGRLHTHGGTLLSVRIPVTPANRRALRALRAAEMAAWEAPAPRTQPNAG